MKKISTLFLLLILSGTLSAQVFWTENFGSGCNLGQLATAYTGVNGAWTVTSTGTNDTYGNSWFVNSRVINTGVGNCGTGSDVACGANPNPNLHIGGNAIAAVGVPADSSSYWTGFFCSFGYCATSNVRAQSPMIDCTNKTSITMAFTYYYGGDLTKSGTNGCATIMYNDGTGWVLLDSINKTTRCSGSTFGTWTAYSIALPASANGNSHVQIGINWSNDDTDTGTDPSFAVDDITVSGSGGAVTPPTAAFAASGATNGCAPFCVSFTDNSTHSPTSWLWTFTGATTTTSTAQNPTACYSDSGLYSVELVATNAGGSDSITISNYIHVEGSPPTPTISQRHDTLFCSYDPSYTAYQWYDSTALISGATQSYYVISQGGNYNVSVSNSNGCQVADGITVGIRNYSFTNNSVSIFPSPAKDQLTVTGNWQSSDGMLSIYDILGKKVNKYALKLDDKVIVNVKNLTQGIYFIKIENDRGEWMGKFEKE